MAKPTKKSGAEARKHAPTAKETKFLRHCARMGKFPQALAAKGATLTNPFEGKRAPVAAKVERVVFSGAPSENFPKWNIPPVFVISDGVTLGVYPRETDALSHFNDRRPGTFAKVATGEKIPRILASALPLA